MSKFAVKEIQFLNRDLCAGFDKELVYIWYVANSRLLPSAPYQTVLKKYPLTNQSRDEICNKLIDAYKSELNVSSKCKYLAFVNEFLESYPQYEERLKEIHIIPVYSVETTPLSNFADDLPDNVCVWEMNHIAPALTGMFFENMLNHIIKGNSFDVKTDNFRVMQKRMDSECNNLSESLYGKQFNMSVSAILSLLNRHFLDKNKMQYGFFRAVIKNKKFCIDFNKETQKLNETHFQNKFVYILWISFLHFLKNDCKSGVVSETLQLLDYIKSNIEELTQYYYELERCTFVRKLLNRYDILDIEHGKSFNNAEIRGEVDFITPNSVIDIKCYKTDEKELWAGQLYLYMCLAQGKPNVNFKNYNLTEGYIINLFNNEVHAYKFEERVKRYADMFPGFGEEEDEIDIDKI